ncbi:unnamed protein product [Brachionus calyciflorus]|uniref:Uncharacterized protein n=1 Tax=Brachionus calyciflorus TaxID=104777 RepID=A0A813WWH4_9BILA|nr:unnamed protein product [Brachionus calyciflorus]
MKIFPLLKVNYKIDVQFAKTFFPQVKPSNLEIFFKENSERELVKYLSTQKPFKLLNDEKFPKFHLNNEHKEFARTVQKSLNKKEFISINDDLVFNKVQDLSKNLDIQIDEKTKHMLKRYISTVRGKLNERSIMSLVNVNTNRNFKKVHKIKTVEFNLFKLTGIADALDIKAKQVLEIKTKQQFNDETTNIDRKDFAQVLAYMNMYKCTSCLYVQCGPDGQLKETYLPFDKPAFDYIIDRINDFCSFARQLTENDYQELLNHYNL